MVKICKRLIGLDERLGLLVNRWWKVKIRYVVFKIKWRRKVYGLIVNFE